MCLITCLFMGIQYLGIEYFGFYRFVKQLKSDLRASHSVLYFQSEVLRSNIIIGNMSSGLSLAKYWAKSLNKKHCELRTIYINNMVHLARSYD